MMLNVTVAIPTIPPRVCGGMLENACKSVREQTQLPSGGISCALDVDKVGAAVTRQRALHGVSTTWVAFLDDDDFFYPNHLETLHRLVVEHQADYAYSWFDGNNPFPGHRGRQMNPEQPHHTTMTVLVRTELAQEVGFIASDDPKVTVSNEDWRFTLECVRLGAKFIGTGDITWHYRRHRQNTSGLPTRW